MPFGQTTRNFPSSLFMPARATSKRTQDESGVSTKKARAWSDGCVDWQVLLVFQHRPSSSPVWLSHAIRVRLGRGRQALTA
eukprot:scaffold178517_cov36-Tisochrysis_lutea.AAC.1